MLLTSLRVEHPLRIVELYRKRAEMENKLHRELKQGWHIESFPSKQHLACLAHIYLTLTLYNVACAYKTERGQELADRGIRRLRAQHLGGAPGCWWYIPRPNTGSLMSRSSLTFPAILPSVFTASGLRNRLDLGILSPF